MLRRKIIEVNEMFDGLLIEEVIIHDQSPIVIIGMKNSYYAYYTALFDLNNKCFIETNFYYLFKIRPEVLEEIIDAILNAVIGGEPDVC